MSSGGKREGAGRKKTQLSRVTGVGHGAGLRKVVAEEILADYEDLERPDILAALAYAARLAHVKRIEILAA